MKVPPNRKVTVEEYLELDRNAQIRSEYFDGEMRQVEFKTLNHNWINTRLVCEIGRQLKEGPFSTMSSTQRIWIDETQAFAYPDIFVYREPYRIAAVDEDTITNPTAIIEVHSAGSVDFDRDAKFRAYAKIPTLSEYVLVDQDEPLIERYHRLTDGNWVFLAIVGIGLRI